MTCHNWIHPWNQHWDQETERSQPPRNISCTPSIALFPCKHSPGFSLEWVCLVCFCTLCKWDLPVCTLLHVASSAQRYFYKIYPYCCLLLKFIHTPGCPVDSHWVNILQIYLSILLLMGIWVVSSWGLLWIVLLQTWQTSASQTLMYSWITWRSCYTMDPQFNRSRWGLGVLSSQVMPVLLVHDHTLNSEALFWWTYFSEVGAQEWHCWLQGNICLTLVDTAK